MDSTPLVSPLKIAIFLTGYFFLINLQSQFEVDAFTFFISYVFLLGFFIALLRYVFVCFLKLINSFRGGVKRIFWSFLSFLIPVGLSLRVVVFNFFSKSFFDLWSSFCRSPIFLMSSFALFLGFSLTLINLFFRPASLSMWAASDRIYVTEAEFILKKSHTRIEVCFFLWSLANRLAFLFFPVYFIFPLTFPFDEPFDGWDCWDDNFRRNTIEWPFFFFVAFLVFDLLCEIYRDWWCVEAVPFFFRWVSTLEADAQAPFLASFYSFPPSLRLILLLGFFFTWWALAYFSFCYIFLQPKAWVFIFMGFNLSFISLLVSMVLCFFMDTVPLLFFVI